MASYPHDKQHSNPTGPFGTVVPLTRPQRPHDEHPRYGVFRLRCDNSKRRAGRTVVTISCYGCLYPDGPVHLHTSELAPTDFLNWRQFTEHLSGLGVYSVVWVALPVAGDGELLA